MRKRLKIIAYTGLAASFVAFGFIAFSSYPRSDSTPASTSTNSVVSEPDAPAVAPSGSMGRVMTYGGLAFLCAVALGLLIAHDFSHFAGDKVEQFVFNDNLEWVKDPEYDEAEQVWANGNHLEAIRLMRDYLNAHPREQYVALRIAEIYEKDLCNHLAAALEYEEILKKALPPERWGWAAIHLANLYSGKLNKTEQAEALLHRVVNEYGHTGAAKKARERLGIAEPAAEAAPLPPAATPPPSNLPPGFRPK